MSTQRPPTVVLEEQEKQWIFAESDLLKTPSILDGMDAAQERELRAKGVNFILQAGIMLKLPNTTLSTAAVFFNRFLMRRSLKSKGGTKALHHYQIAATALFLATKVEENCRKMKELVVACCRVAQKNPTLKIDEQTKDFWRWRDTILFSEDVMLEAICFDLTIEAPHKIMYDMLRAFNLEHEKKLRNAAWAFLNDSNLTQLCLLFTSRTIAAASLFCAARHCGVEFPDQKGRPWWEYLNVRLTEIQRACNYMATIYENSDSNNLYSNSSTSPEDIGNVNLAKTRPRRSQSPNSSTSMERGGSDSGVKRSREGSVLSVKKEEAIRVAHEQSVTEELMQDAPDAKKARLDSQGANGASEADDAGSEEGELEG